MTHSSGFVAFANESNKIEGMPPATDLELNALSLFVFSAFKPTVAALESYVSAVAPGHVLRRKPGLNVRIGDHIAPPGGAKIVGDLTALLNRAAMSEDLYLIHVAYEILHPFTDGNGRSGRALWLWQMLQTEDSKVPFAIGFLHTFYYQTLEHAR